MKRQIRIASGLIVAALLFFLTYQCSMSATDEKPLATWIWDADIITSDMDRTIDFLERNKVTTLYLQISRDLSVNTYKTFIEKTNQKGITVYALNGSPHWNLADDELKKFLDWVNDYQNTASDTSRFKGIHVDIEPYLTKKWEQDKDKEILEFQELLIYIKEFAHSRNLLMGADIPFWFDEQEFANKFGNGQLAKWVIEQMDETVIMAYRDQADGNNGISKLIEEEVNWGKQLNKKIIIAVETKKSSEEYTTFYHQKVSEMEKELNKVRMAYSNETPLYFAIHDLQGWQGLYEYENRSTEKK